jgi:alcohol dehydrogenase class IV
MEIFINPSRPNVGAVEECAQVVQERGFDLIVGLGGSPMDVARAAVVLPMGKMRPLFGRNLLTRKGIPTLMIRRPEQHETTQAVVVTSRRGPEVHLGPRIVPEAAVWTPE